MKENQTIAQFLGITKFPYIIKNEQGKIIYFEELSGYWIKKEFDSNGNQTRYEDSNGFWVKREFNINGNETRYEDSYGIWKKSEYDAKGNKTRFEDSKGYWSKSEFDANGKEIYFESSYGINIDNRPKQVELTLAEIASKLNIPLELLRIKD